MAGAMTFQAPLFLLALLAVPLLAAALIAERRRRRRYVVRFTGVSTLRTVMAGTPAWRGHAPAVLFLPAVAAPIVRPGRPQPAGPLAPREAPGRRPVHGW